MSGLEVALIGALATVAASLFGYLGTRQSRQSSRESNDTNNWAEILKGNNEQNARLNSEIRDLRTDQSELRTRVDDLEHKLDDEQRVRRSAFDYIRVLLRWIEERLPGVTPPAPPELLGKDL